jgi:hypothetical protein
MTASTAITATVEPTTTSRRRRVTFVARPMSCCLSHRVQSVRVISAPEGSVGPRLRTERRTLRLGAVDLAAGSRCAASDFPGFRVSCARGFLSADGVLRTIE